jgi:DNA adenine methylase
LKSTQIRTIRKKAEVVRAPLLRWAGSKKLILPLLLKIAPSSYPQYVEPFAGSARLFFALEPPRSILADSNRELMLFYRILKKDPIGLYQEVLRFKKKDYYNIRSLEPAALRPVARAARLLFLSRYCFNGIYRTNRHNIFNVPMGANTGSMPRKADFIRCSYALRQATLRNCDFEQLSGRIGQDDFVYLDPPYLKSDKFTGQYGANSFAITDIPRLLAFLDIIDKRRARFILSYIENKLMIDVAHKRRWRIIRTKVKRRVAACTDHRGPVNETLIMNY